MSLNMTLGEFNETPVEQDNQEWEPAVLNMALEPLYIHQEVVVSFVWFVTYLVNQLELQTSVVWSRTDATSKVSQVDTYQLYAKEADKNFRKTREGDRQAGGVVIASE